MQQTAQKAVEAVQQAQPAVSEELKKALLDFTKSTLEAVKDGAHQTVDFAKEQVPLVLQEIVRARILEACAWAVFTAMLLTICIWISRRFDRWSKQEDCVDVTGARIGYWAVRVPSIVIFGGLTLLNIFHALYAWWFPRLTILEYLANLAKTVTS